MASAPRIRREQDQQMATAYRRRCSASTGPRSDLQFGSRKRFGTSSKGHVQRRPNAPRQPDALETVRADKTGFGRNHDYLGGRQEPWLDATLAAYRSEP